jgi:leucyl-tRNA synthetase
VNRYIRAFTIMISPICPHWAQHIWELIGEKGLIHKAAWPEAGEEDK